MITVSSTNTLCTGRLGGIGSLLTYFISASAVAEISMF